MTLTEIKNKLPEKIAQLKVTDKFKSNPAFASYINDILQMINNLNLNDQINFSLTENEGGLYLEYTALNETGKISITAVDFKTIACKILATKNLGFSSKLGRDLRKKSVTDLIAHIENNDEINEYINTAILSDINSSDKTIDLLVVMNLMKYSQYGILYEKERKILNPDLYLKPFDSFTGKDMFDIISLDGKLNQSEKISEFVKYSRNTIDTARVIYLNNLDNTKYCGVVELDKEHSLRNLIPVMPIKSLITSVSKTNIRELSLEEIEELISRESNEKIKEGLKQYATSRIGYTYSNDNDPYYFFTFDHKHTR